MNLPRWSKVLAIIIPWSIAVILFGWIVSLRFPPDGIVHFGFVFDGRSPWFNPFQPGERVTSPGQQPDGWVGQRILNEPVYASARQPGAYDKVNLSFEVKPLRQPIAEMGLMRDEASFSFEMKPLFAEALTQGWRAVNVNGVKGMVAEGYPDEALLRSGFDRLMVWHASATSPTLSDTGTGVRQYEVSLRGAHDFYVVPVDGFIEFKFGLQDVNRSREAKNRAAFRITRDEEVISLESVSVSGSADRNPSAVFEQTVTLAKVPPGVYRISFLADDDFFIRSIRTNVRRWVIGPRLYFGDEVGYRENRTPPVVWTNSLHIAADTFHKEGLQRVSLGSANTQIKLTHTPYPLDRHPDERLGDSQLKTEKGSIRFTGDGFFALERDALFFPRPRRLTPEADPVAEGIIAILTPYVPAEAMGDGWYRVHASWSLAPTQEPLRFSLGLPGIAVRNGALDIRHVDLQYVRPALSFGEWWRALKRELATAWKRL